MVTMIINPETHKKLWEYRIRHGCKSLSEAVDQIVDKEKKREEAEYAGNT